MGFGIHALEIRGSLGLWGWGGGGGEDLGVQ